MKKKVNLNMYNLDQPTKALSKNEKAVILFLAEVGQALASEIGYATCNLNKGGQKTSPQGASLATARVINRLKEKRLIQNCVNGSGFVLTTTGRKVIKEINGV
jgi:hypothetical protein